MAERTLTIALERLDRHVPFFIGTVTPPPGVTFRALEVGVGFDPGRRDGIDRHGRMFRDREFDICEQSLASFIMSRSRSDAFIATPVFPRRLFSQNCIFVNVDSGIETPMDLVGKRVAVWSFQTTLSVLAKGDLKGEHGVPWDRVTWCIVHHEELPWRGEGLDIINLPKDRDAGQMLVDGEIDAMIHPQPPSAALRRPDRVRRLFPDARAESLRHFSKYGYCPIMHLLVFTRELAEREPWLPRAMIDCWEDAKHKADEFYEDPGYSLLVFARNEYEWQRDTLGADLFPSGLAANRANLEQFIGYVADQGLIDKPLPVESLFHESVLDT
jgi:4,5-dihydroxyphthalate decarboxylase